MIGHFAKTKNVLTAVWLRRILKSMVYLPSLVWPPAQLTERRAIRARQSSRQTLTISSWLLDRLYWFATGMLLRFLLLCRSVKLEHLKSLGTLGTLLWIWVGCLRLALHTRGKQIILFIILVSWPFLGACDGRLSDMTGFLYYTTSRWRCASTFFDVHSVPC